MATTTLQPAQTIGQLEVVWIASSAFVPRQGQPLPLAVLGGRNAPSGDARFNVSKQQAFPTGSPPAAPVSTVCGRRRADRLKFSSGDKLKGTPDEYKQAALSTSVYFGRYTIDPAKATITFHIDWALPQSG